MKHTTAAAVLLTSMLTAGSASAACDPASANGKWDLYFGFNEICTGSITNGAVQMTCTKEGFPYSSSLSGTLGITLDCRLIGTLTLAYVGVVPPSGSPLPFGGVTLSPNHQVIKGLSVVGYGGFNNIISGVRR